MDYSTTQRNTTDTTQQNAPQHNKTGNKNHAHMLNKPVEVTSSSTKNSTEKTVKKRCRYMPMTYLSAVELCCTRNKVDIINNVSQTISLQREPPPIQNFIDYPLPLTSYLFQLLTCNLPPVGRLDRFFFTFCQKLF